MGFLDLCWKYKLTYLSYKNYLYVMLCMHKRNKKEQKGTKISVILKNDNKYDWTFQQVFMYSLLHEKYTNISFPELADDLNNNCLHLKYNNKTIVLYNCINNGDIHGVFLSEEYKFLNVKNETVIDIGANIADSSIYFALNDAQKIIALEPYPYSYNSAKKNIEINDLDNKIDLLNAAYGQDKK